MLDDYPEATANIGSKKITFWREAGQQFNFGFS